MVEMTPIAFVVFTVIAIIVGYVVRAIKDYYQIADMDYEIRRLSEKCLYQDIQRKEKENEQ